MRRSLAAAGLGLSLCLAGGAFAATTLYRPRAWRCCCWPGRRRAGCGSPPAVCGWSASSSGTSVQEQAPLRVTVRAARTRVPLPGVEARAWPGGPLLSLARSRDASITAEIRFARRGRHELAPASVVIGDPLGLAGRTILSSADAVLVLPRIEPLQLTDLVGHASSWGRRGAPALGAGATEVDSLVVHQPGAPASRIHWPTVARTSTLMERRLVDDGDQAPLVVVDPRDPSSPDALDQALRAAASLCVHLARDGAVRTAASGRSPAGAVRSRAAWLSPSRTRGSRCSNRTTGRPRSAAWPVRTRSIWVTAVNGRADSVAQLRVPARYLVSPHPRPGWPVRFTVAGCSGQWLEERGRRAA